MAHVPDKGRAIFICLVRVHMFFFALLFISASQGKPMQSYSLGSSRKADAIIMRVLFPFSNGCGTVLVSAREFGSLKRDRPCLLIPVIPPTTGKVAKLDSEDAVLESLA